MKEETRLARLEQRHNLPATVVKPSPPALQKRPIKPRSSDPLEIYMAQISQIPLLSREEELYLARRFANEGDKDAARRLVEANLRFVVKMAHSYKSFNVKLIDLVQEGNIGLMRAVQSFDPDKGFKLISYAVWWIKAYMQNYIIRNWSMVRLGSSQLQKQLFFKKEDKERELDEASRLLGMEDDPTDQGEEILILSAAKKSRNSELAMAYEDFYLDAQLPDGSGRRFLDNQADDAPGPEQSLVREDMVEKVAQRLPAIISQLSEKEKLLLKRRLLADEPSTLQDLGQELGVSRERVRQLESKLKNKLANLLQGVDSASEELA